MMKQLSFSLGTGRSGDQGGTSSDRHNGSFGFGSGSSRPPRNNPRAPGGDRPSLLGSVGSLGMSERPASSSSTMGGMLGRQGSVASLFMGGGGSASNHGNGGGGDSSLHGTGEGVMRRSLHGFRQISAVTLGGMGASMGTGGQPRPNMLRGSGTRAPPRPPNSAEAQKIAKLEQEMREKDEQLQTLRAFTTDKQCLLDDLKQQTDGLRKKQKEEVYVRKLEVARLRRDHASLQDRISSFRRDMTDTQSIHQYANLIQEAAPQSVDSTYVMRLQSQLSKAMKKMEKIQSQIDVVKERCETVEHSMRAELMELVDDKSKTEIELEDQISDFCAKHEEILAGLLQEKDSLAREKDDLKGRIKELQKKKEDEKQQEEEEKTKKKRDKGDDEGDSDDDDNSDEKGDEPQAPTIVSKKKTMMDLSKQLEHEQRERVRVEEELRGELRRKKEHLARLQQHYDLQTETLANLRSDLELKRSLETKG